MVENNTLVTGWVKRYAAEIMRRAPEVNGVFARGIDVVILLRKNSESAENEAKHILGGSHIERYTFEIGNKVPKGGVTRAQVIKEADREAKEKTTEVFRELLTSMGMSDEQLEREAKKAGAKTHKDIIDYIEALPRRKDK